MSSDIQNWSFREVMNRPVQCIIDLSYEFIVPTVLLMFQDQIITEGWINQSE